jgi:hypothetical protein
LCDQKTQSLETKANRMYRDLIEVEQENEFIMSDSNEEKSENQHVFITLILIIILMIGLLAYVLGSDLSSILQRN